VSDLDVFGMLAKIDANRSSDSYAAQRKKLMEESGLAGIWKKQQEEMDRLKEESSPEAQKRAFWNNLSAQLAGQIGQRGVSRSSRLAQMLGAYGGTKASTDEEFRKRNADLNKAALELQEKQAMYRTTGSMQDRAEAEKAQARYEGFLKDKAAIDQRAEDAKQRAQEAQDANQDRAARLKQGDRELELRAARDKQQGDHEKAMQDIAAGRVPEAQIKSLLTSYSDQLRDITSRLKAADLLPDEKTSLEQEYKEVVGYLNDVRRLVGKGVKLPDRSSAPASPTLVNPSLIAAERNRRGL
jgi:hypothetical protein